MSSHDLAAFAPAENLSPRLLQHRLVGVCLCSLRSGTVPAGSQFFPLRAGTGSNTLCLTSSRAPATAGNGGPMEPVPEALLAGLLRTTLPVCQPWPTAG